MDFDCDEEPASYLMYEEEEEEEEEVSESISQLGSKKIRGQKIMI